MNEQQVGEGRGGCQCSALDICHDDGNHQSGSHDLNDSDYMLRLLSTGKGGGERGN